MFKIMTLNINYYGAKFGPWNARKELIATVIDDLQPDVVVLQAVRRDSQLEGGRDQAQQLADLLADYPTVHFAPSAHYDDGREEGGAMLARGPIESTEIHPLTYEPNPEDFNERALLVARVRIHGGAIAVVNGHFSWVPAINRRNVDEALALLARLDAPAILAGDLNAPPDSAGMQRLRDSGWIDAWAALRDGDAGYTFEADAPQQRIDYIWLHPQLAPRLRAIDVVSGRGDDGARLSDHYGLIATFE